ncbi:S-adenosyl-L-methionine-dependent methyltransferase [Coemansia reversa NRRL 1564]|uniref:S-adenosyl-L-methionine-dependent methyltransferase n=1 Tax=Coemansia reversa (strain ATCC 12441 / NRRL 1564) TaxID=763665 RepID=A0A2G5BEY4_COERN|nr:S-adenosyl-L-methionine-dependent methyltransferase [Coemansia reversa NRRL 1564]|eukprot:PIA17578.1 S-adenosyl-L-methionine-dependent methyltransferase [Coemansia reversa NRRL 1564]
MVIVFLFNHRVRVTIIFAYNCFIRPLGQNTTQQGRLDKFYKNQAKVYDVTRSRLLRGRRTMLRLCAAEVQKNTTHKQGLVWIDLGGGTGWNIEQMCKYLDNNLFKRIYLVDLCRPLCNIAEQRFKEKGWHNIRVICQDASHFVLPVEDSENGADLITMSYSLSMIDNFYSVISNVRKLLRSQSGIFGVVDFYVSDSSDMAVNHSNAIGSSRYKCNWFTRVFWQHWFELDHVYLYPSRRNYLEHCFDTLKVINERNHFIIPYLVQIPYYIWLGANLSPSKENNSKVESRKALKQMPTRFSIHSPLINNKGWTRFPYNASGPEHVQFKTYIYGFTWEDPKVDIDFLDLQSGDNIMVITSAGDNALAYATQAEKLTIHCVDMNPCQNHLFELKLAALCTMDYEGFWKMFGTGKLSDFERILDLNLSSFLSLPSYEYWRANTSVFNPSHNSIFKKLTLLSSDNLYTTGYSGFALQCLKVVAKLLGVNDSIQQMALEQSLDSQIILWNQHIFRRLMQSFAVRLLDNRIAMWHLMGVPTNQWKMLHNEGSMSQYVRDTIDPVATSTTFSQENYFYHLLIKQQYSRHCCPEYLTKTGFCKLKQVTSDPTHTTFYIHTATIIDTLQKMEPGTLSKAVLMDHMDWFAPNEAELEIKALCRALKQNGMVLWRSVARIPWYISNFEKNGFAVEALSIRQPNTQIALDRVNMYASLYKATKL